MLNITGTHFSGLFRGEVMLKASPFENKIILISEFDTDHANYLELEPQVFDCCTETEDEELPEPECTCEQIDVDRVDARGCEVHGR